ncbi:hypothetical protein FOZ62_009469, partial [Perkinsus olseni]
MLISSSSSLLLLLLLLFALSPSVAVKLPVTAPRHVITGDTSVPLDQLGSFLEASPRRSGSEVLEEEEGDEEDEDGDDEAVVELPLAMSILGVARPAPSHSAWDSGVVPDSAIESAPLVESPTSTLTPSGETVSLVERHQSSSSPAMTANPGAVLKLVVAWCSNIWFICLASIGAYFAYDKMYDQRRRTKSVI